MRRLLLLLSLLVLSACPVSYKARVLNSGRTSIELRPPYASDVSVSVDPDEKQEFPWHQPCLELVDGTQTLFFETFSIPEDAFRVGLFSVSVESEYRDGKLRVFGADGSSTEVPRAERSCTNR